MENMTEMLKGLLEGMVLEIISQGETYGYEITKRLAEIDFSEIVEGTVYAILLRLEKKGYVSIEKKTSSKGPTRKFYTLNEAGKKELILFWEKWAFLSTKINQLKEN